MNAELHEHLMRVTVDTFKRETDKLKEQLRRESALAEEYRKHFMSSDAWRMGLSGEIDHLRSILVKAGYERAATGEWKPPLGKRPDFEGQDVVAAAMAFVEAQRNIFDAARKYRGTEI